MRAMSAADVARYANGFFRVKVEVEDAGSTWRDLSTLPTFNAIRSVDWGEDVDSPGMTADVTFWRNLDAISLSPLHETSPINRTTPFDAGGSFSALLSVNRRLRISWALLPDDRETPSTWAGSSRRHHDGSWPSVSTIQFDGNSTYLPHRAHEV